MSMAISSQRSKEIGVRVTSLLMAQESLRAAEKAEYDCRVRLYDFLNGCNLPMTFAVHNHKVVVGSGYQVDLEPLTIISIPLEMETQE